MKLTFDLNKSAMTGKVQVQRTVNRNGTTFQQHFWVNPSDVKETDKVIGQTKGTESTVSPHKLGYYIDVASFKEKYAKALGIPTDRIKLGGRTRDSVDSNVVTFQIYDDSKHHGAHSTPQRGYDLGEIAIDTKNKTIQIRKPTFGDATSDTLGKAKKALDESKVNANQKQTNDTAKKDLDKKSDKSKSINPDKPVNIDDFKFTDYKNPDGQNTDKRKTYKSAMKDWSEQTEKLYERAMKNYWGDTPPEKQLHTAFMNLNREASIRDLVSNSSEAGLKEARDAIYARQNKLIEMSKKYTKWDSSKGKWIEGNSKDTSKDSTTDKAPDKAVGKNTTVVLFGQRTMGQIYLLDGILAMLLVTPILLQLSIATLCIPILYTVLHLNTWKKLTSRQGATLNPILGNTARNLFVFTLLFLATAILSYLLQLS